MFLSAISNRFRHACRATIARSAPVVAASLVIAAAIDPAIAAGCAFAPQGEGRVTEVIDARSFRLEDGRDVSLIGIEPVSTIDPKANRAAALAAIVGGHEVTLRGDDDTPDRYGRQPAFVFVGSSDTPVQATLLAQGAALLAATVTDKEGAATLAAAEASGSGNGESGPIRPS